MALEASTVSIGFGPGLDSKTDPKVSAKPILLKDCIFTAPREIAKRNGYSQMTTAIVGESTGVISNPVMIRSYRNELVCAANASGCSQTVQSAIPLSSFGGSANGFQPVTLQGQRLFSYSPSLNAWQDRGKYVSVKVSKQIVSGQDIVGVNTSGGSINQSCAISGNIALFCCLYVNPSTFASGTPVVQITVIDQSNGAILSNNTPIVNAVSNPRAILLGASTLAVTYINASGALILRVITVTASGGVSIGSEVTIAPATVTLYDIVNTAAGATMIYSSSSQIHVATVTASGASPILLVTNAAVGLSVCIGSGGNAWFYWFSGSPGNYNLSYSVYSSNIGSHILTATSISTGIIFVPANISAYNNSSTQQTVYWSVYSIANSVTSPQIFLNTVTQSGVVGPLTSFLNNVDIASKISSVSSANYMAVMALSQFSPTGFIVDLNDGYAVAKFLPNQAAGISNSSFSVLNNPFINPLIQISSTELFLCQGYISELIPVVNTTTTGYAETVGTLVYGMCGLTFDFNNIDAYQSVIQQDTLLLNGGVVSQYDGGQVSELGFSVDPDGFYCAVSSTGGSGASGNWVYYSTDEWIDSSGNLHQSAPSLGFLVVVSSGTTSSVVLTKQTLTMSQKSNVVTSFWRTLSNGTIAYKIGSVANNPNVNLVTMTDTFSGGLTDANIQANFTLYTEGGAILENIAPPASMILWTNNNRAWCIDSENPETTIEYTKTASKGSGVAFSTGQLEYIVDSKNGPVTGASPMDEKTVLLKQGGIGYFIGDGANDSGTGSSLSNYQFVPSDTGCVNSKSVISYPGGIIFKAAKGLYLLSRGLQISYFGMDVEAYNAQDVQAATIVYNKNQIRFLTSSGLSLLYDYVMNQWSVFTNHTGFSADLFQGSYVYARTDGSVYQENTTSFLDNTSPYPLYALLQWIKASSIQNFQRARVIEMLGDFKNGSSSGHGVQISAAYDFGTTFSSPIGYPFGASSASGPFQYREHLPRQKCGSIQLLIQEVTTGASGEYVDFTDLGIEIATKRGLNKLPATQSV